MFSISKNSEGKHSFYFTLNFKIYHFIIFYYSNTKRFDSVSSNLNDIQSPIFINLKLIYLKFNLINKNINNYEIEIGIQKLLKLMNI